MSAVVEKETIGIYLSEIGRYPLLSADEEISLGHKVVKLTQIVETRQKLSFESRPVRDSDVAAHLGITESEVRRREHEGRRAKTRMVECNMRLVVTIAKKYQNRNIDLLDLIQEGSLGLSRGVEKFDPTMGYKFSTYAYHWIHQAIRRSIHNNSRSIRLPIHINEKLNRIRKTYRELAQELNRNPKVSEVAKRLDMTPEQVHELTRLNLPAVSLNLRTNQDKSSELLELIADQRDSLFEKTLDRTLVSDLNWALSNYLTPVERQVIEMRYGFADGRAMTLREVGDAMDLSHERVRQIQNKAIKKLRSHRAASTLKGWVREEAV